MKICLLVFLMVGLLTLTGAQQRPGDGKGTPSLKVEEARQALIVLVERSNDEPVRMSPPGLKKSKAVSVGGNQIALGEWRCDLAEKTFVLSLASDAGMFEVSGVFERSAGDKWRAVVRRKRMR